MMVVDQLATAAKNWDGGPLDGGDAGADRATRRWELALRLR